MTGSPIRVAFTMISRQNWAGGYNYQRNLFAAVHRFCPNQITPVVFAGERNDPADLEALGSIPKVETAQSAAFNSSLRQRATALLLGRVTDQRTDPADLEALGSIPGVEIARSAAFNPSLRQMAAALLLGHDCAEVAEFRRKKVDVVFEAARFFGWRLPYPTVAWIPDLQHQRLPHLFPAIARWRREFGLRTQIASGRWIMLSSESALQDCLASYPAAAGRTSVVKFAAQPSPELLNADPAEIVNTYELPRTYFYLPNQFYRHKNHGVVIDALEILSKRGVNVTIVASGSNSDPREPGYFGAIMRKAAESGLQRNFRYLGMIPLPHVYALLRAAVALINPSKFEGWSTTVEEAKCFNVPMILSDIDVHREQAGANALYFDVDDPGRLADHLEKLSCAETSPRSLLPQLEASSAEFAESFVQTIERAAASFPAPTLVTEQAS
jgi:glycosyltransferase involved in cell wall biosynthesis